MAEGARYFKLGKGASVFYDAAAKLKVLPGQVTMHAGKFTAQMQAALGQGHIVEADEKDYNDSAAAQKKVLEIEGKLAENQNKKKLVPVLEVPPTAEEYDKLSLEDLRKLAEAQVDETDVDGLKALKSYNKKQLINFLVSE